MSGLLFGLFFIGGLALVVVALQLNSSSREQTLFYVEKAVELRSDSIMTVMGDYAFWGDAYERMNGDIDVDWAYTRNNLGAHMFESFEYEGLFVVNGNNITTYAVIDGELRQDLTLDNWLKQDVVSLLAEARQLAEDEEVAFAVIADQGHPMMIATAAFTSGGDPYVKEMPGPGSVLVMVDRLGPAKLAAAGESFGISQLRVANDSDDANAPPALRLDVMNGEPITLRWEPPQPGDTMLMWLFPILILGLLVFAYITRFNLRATLAAARKADASHNEARRFQAELVFQATHDSLTGLPNRPLLEERLKQACLDAQQAGGHLAVMLIDLDGFKPINDNFSHYLGDQVLVEVAKRMLAIVRPGDTVARMGGDEFIVILPGVANEHAVSTIAERLLADIADPYQIDTIDLRVTASVGVVMSDGDIEQPLQLIRQADAAMYQAKQEGRNNASWYTRGLSQQEYEMTQLRNDLQHAIDTHALELHYQPQVDSGTRKVAGAEALLRWSHPVRGPVSPAYFIPIAETTGQIIPLTLWVLDTACRHLRELTDAGIALPCIAVNISSTHLLRASFVPTIQAALDKHRLRADQLELEITETVLMDHADRALDTLHQLKNMGVKLAIDDFGVGFSSMNYLKVLPINKIKIDRSFIKGIDHNAQDAAICQGIISMAHHLNLRITAEGVEREGQRDFLVKNQCDELQGYLFAKPMNFTDLCSLINQLNPASTDADLI
ncbi:putative bifunctional diguanylate cyclase/phosphodiesterase [Halopseudomonas laoshanensis]|nr:bifunctional diguanylate cyclase/phosphodiesterase [Halopseudomonas laoshanensis]